MTIPPLTPSVHDAYALYRNGRFPGDYHGNCLETWDRYERDYPDTFRSMYQFWVRKTKTS